MKTWAETRELLIAAGIPAEQLPVEWEPGINLRGADLRWADLRGANLREAHLSEASGGFTTGYFGRHHAVAAGGYISIGCERHIYDEWLANAEAIGQENCYTADEIADYVAWIKLAVARQRRIEEVTQ